MAKMNSTSLYITTNQIILKSDPNNPSTWQDLYSLAPDLRNSLCCVVCGNLLINPQSPAIGKCQHHLCRQCKDGTKKINPACVWCNDCKEYSENKTLQILLQCYKRMCITLGNSGIFRRLVEQASQSNMASSGAGNLITLIKEGAAFQDDHQINVGLLRSVYSSLPSTYPTSSTQTLQLNQTDKTRSILLNSNLQNVTSSNTLQSVMYAGSDNEYTIQQKPTQLKTDNEFSISSTATTACLNKPVSKKPPDISICNSNLGNITTANTLYSIVYAGPDNKIYIGPPTTMDYLNKSAFKTPPKKRISKPRRSCRCGIGIATPGPLTCFGQRCPCYVESKSCMKCKCRGCRNPFRPDGTRVRPQTPYSKNSQPATLAVSGQEQQLELQKQPLLQNVNTEPVSNPTKEQLNEHPMVKNIKVFHSYAKPPMSFTRYINKRKKNL